MLVDSEGGMPLDLNAYDGVWAGDMDGKVVLSSLLCLVRGMTDRFEVLYVSKQQSIRPSLSLFHLITQQIELSSTHLQ